MEVNWNSITWKDWQSAQRMIDLHEKHRYLYSAYLFWLLLQSVIAFILLVLVIAVSCIALIAVFSLFQHQYLGIGIVGFLLLIWAICFFSELFQDSCKDMFLVDKYKYHKIYDIINDISRQINGPQIHDIYINHEFNAAASKKLFFTPFRRNILILGYPLLCSLSFRGLVGCLAHEIGHIKHHHMSIIYIFFVMLLFWAHIPLKILPTCLFAPWICYWIPAITKAIAPLKRHHEIEADKYIVKTFGGDHLAACQVELLLKEEQYSDVIEQLILQMRGASWSKTDILQLFRDGLNEKLPDERNERVINHAMKSVPNVFDEHPSFAQRLALANCRSPLPFAKFESDALEKLIGHNIMFDKELNVHFHGLLERPAKVYQEEYDESYKWLVENLQSLSDMTEHKLCDVLACLKVLGRTEERLKLLQRCMDKYPNFLKFRALMALEHVKDDPDAAAAELEYCISKSPLLYKIDENNFLLQYYIDSGDVEKIHAYLDLRDGRIEKLKSDYRRPLEGSDEIYAATLPEHIMIYFVYAFMYKFQYVRRAYYVQRVMDENLLVSQSFIVLECTRSFLISMDEIKREIYDAFSPLQYNISFRDAHFCDTYLEPIADARFYRRD